MSAKQEKFHFVAATNGKLDNFDGEPDQAYIEDVQRYMIKIFRGWDSGSTRKDYLQWGTPYFISDYVQKFPFSIHRFHETMNEYKYTGAFKTKFNAVQDKNTPSGVRPDVCGTTVVHDAKVRVTSDPKRTTAELQAAQVLKALYKPYNLK